MKIFGKILITFLFGVIFLFAGKTAMAGLEIYGYDIQQRESDTDQIIGTAGPDWVAQSFQPASTTFYGYQLEMCKTGALTGDLYFSICYNDGTGAWRCDHELDNQTFTASSYNSTINDCGTAYSVMSWVVPLITTTSTENYSLRLQYTGANQLYIRKQATTNPYADGYIATRNSGTAITTNYPDDDAYFATISDITKIEWIQPTDLQSLEDFNYWQVRYNLFGYATGVLRIAYAETGKDWSNISDYAITDNENGNVLSIEKVYPLYSGTNYTASALIFAGAGDNALASSTITFDITIGEDVPTSTLPLTDLNSTCDTADGLFQESMCYVFEYLFRPSQDSLNRWQGLRDDLDSKPPFGYFTLVSDELSNINGSSTPAFSLPDMTGLSGIIDPMRTGIAIILWLAFVLYLYWRVKHLEL